MSLQINWAYGNIIQYKKRRNAVHIQWNMFYSERKLFIQCHRAWAVYPFSISTHYAHIRSTFLFSATFICMRVSMWERVNPTLTLKNTHLSLNLVYFLENMVEYIWLPYHLPSFILNETGYDNSDNSFFDLLMIQIMENLTISLS